MDVYSVNRIGRAVGYGVISVSSGAGGNAGSFREQLGGQLKDDYRKRVTDLLDELASLSDDMLDRVDVHIFESYLGQMKALLNEIVKNAYVLDSEHILDVSGRQRIFASVGVVDLKLDELARDVLNKNGDRLDYLSRVDEIRGLVMDMLM